MKIVKLTEDQFINGRLRVKGEIVSGNYDGQTIAGDINIKNKAKTNILLKSYGKIKQDKLSAKI